MSNLSNTPSRVANRFVTSNKQSNQFKQLAKLDPNHNGHVNKHRKCAFHIYSYHYANNMRKHDEIIKHFQHQISTTEMNSVINIKMAFHFLAPKNSFSKDRVMSRIHDVISSLNDDFNNYTNNQNTMNNFKYKSIVNQVFVSNINKQKTYLSEDYLKALPLRPSNIIFEYGQVYFYPMESVLNLSLYDHLQGVELQQQAIKQYIHQNRADAILPDFFMNVWIIDMIQTPILGFSNFPWETPDSYHGIVLNRRVFFPEDYEEANFNLYKTFTHHVGHFFGLLHVYGKQQGLGAYNASNLNIILDPQGQPGQPEYVMNFPTQWNTQCDPSDKNQQLHSDSNFNPLFMNYMDYTHDKYVAVFTHNQIQKMRFMIINYRPKLNSRFYDAVLPLPKYNPETNTMMNVVDMFHVPTQINYDKLHEPKPGYNNSIQNYSDPYVTNVYADQINGVKEETMDGFDQFGPIGSSNLEGNQDVYNYLNHGQNNNSQLNSHSNSNLSSDFGSNSSSEYTYTTEPKQVFMQQPSNKEVIMDPLTTSNKIFMHPPSEPKPVQTQVLNQVPNQFIMQPPSQTYQQPINVERPISKFMNMTQFRNSSIPQPKIKPIATTNIKPPTKEMKKPKLSYPENYNSDTNLTNSVNDKGIYKPSPKVSTLNPTKDKLIPNAPIRDKLIPNTPTKRFIRVKPIGMEYKT